ncbi:hypothetical protein LSCM4_05387 [Leishmania orientalis]|uniref:Mnd1 HTH domain-containing protein n=1 Tax=Leishmania orientalis TaxID=2249476 RepID=A0A836H5K4_9TRYP|nr:hypothetical protein LSCM4_05387 [Leishmania orientalis]
MSRAAAAVGAAKRSTKTGLSIEEKVVLVERWMAAHPQPYTLKELQLLIPKQTPVVYQSVEECVTLLVAEGRIEEDRVGVSTLLWKFPSTATQLANRSSGQHGRNGGLGSRLGSGATLYECPLSYTELLQRLTANGAAAQRRQQQQVSVETMERWCASTPTTQLREWRDMLQAENNRTAASLSAERERLNLGIGEHDDEDTPAGEAVVLAELARHQELELQRAQLLAEHKKLSSRQALPDLLAQLGRASSIALEAANRWTDNYYLAEEEVVGKVGFGGSRRDVRAALQLPLELNYLSDESDAETNLGGCQGQEGVDGCSSSRPPCVRAHDATLQACLPLGQASQLRAAGGPPSAQDEHRIAAASHGDSDFPAAQVDVRDSEPTPAAAAATSVAHTDTTVPPSTSSKAKPSKAAKASSAKRSTAKRARSRCV